MCCRRSQWAGAKALVKLIKPRKESSRERGAERERTKSAPDIPLPATPPLLPPETPPPPPQRTLSDSQDGGHSSPGLQSPAVTPISRGTHTHTHRNLLNMPAECFVFSRGLAHCEVWGLLIRGSEHMWGSCSLCPVEGAVGFHMTDSKFTSGTFLSS